MVNRAQPTEHRQAIGEMPRLPLILLIVGVGAILLSLAARGPGSTPGLHMALVSFGGGLLLVGGLSLVLRSQTGRNERRHPAAFQLLYGQVADPMALTDLSGRVLSCNLEMRRLVRRADRHEIGRCLRHWGQAADGLVPGLARRAAAGKEATAVLDPGAGGYSRVRVARLGSDLLEWRVMRTLAIDSAAAPDYRSAPFLQVSLGHGERIVRMNRRVLGPDGKVPTTLSELLGDPPLRPGGVHTLRGRPEESLRCLVKELPDGTRELFLFPTDPAEAHGVTPDRFLDHLPVGLARLTMSGELVFVNRAARALLGERAVPGLPLSDLVEGLGRSIPDRLMEVSRGRRLARSEIARSRGGDRDLFLQVALNRLVVEGDISVIAVISDATEMKALEAQFVQSQKMQAVGQLAGGVAHDFNNLLTAICGHCDLLLLRHEAGDADHGDLLQVRQNANRAAALVRQLLAFSRKQTLRPKVLNMVETLSELTHLLNRLLGERVTLRIESDRDIGPVKVDERQFEQVIMNLVVNARDAMPQGGEVFISTRNLHLRHDVERDRATIPAGDYVLIEVADTGCGIPEDRRNKIFEPFFTTKRPGEGTGLGLSTAYGIVKQTGGFIFAASVPGRGSTFSIYLPVYEGEPAGDAVIELPSESGRDLTGKGTVLLVEDEAPVRSFAARALRLRGYTVLEAASGEEALEITGDAEQRIDLLVSDVVMPGVDGPTWVREARRTRPDIKVIFVSGYAEEVFKEDGDALAGAVFLAKPFSLNDLTAKVKDMIEVGETV